jgi:carbonic anhydrase
MFEQLSLGQHPRILFITCCDSRIDPNLITQIQPGELFIIRNVGNIIPPYGAITGSEGAAIEYAVETLAIKDIIICGHSHCGAMKGLLQLGSLTEQMPLVHDWLKYAEATRRIIKENYQDYEGEELLNAAIEENVMTQIENLRTYPAIHAKLYKGQLNITLGSIKLRREESLFIVHSDAAFKLNMSQMILTMKRNFNHRLFL